MANLLSAQFVFIRIRNTKPWNHLHMCTVVLCTKIVVEFVCIEQTAAIKNGRRQANRYAMQIAICH